MSAHWWNSFFGWGITVAVLLQLSCTSEQPVQGPATVVSTGMTLIEADGASFVMGSTDGWASDDEHPPMQVSFDYNFQMDTAEVTVAQFRELTGYLPREYPSADSSSLKPICYVTWYDAVLFCNRRSILAGLDTVYRYTGVDQTTDGRVFRINGLVTDFSRTGYRLPTEAEWEFCARAGTATSFFWGDDGAASVAAEYAWSALNSGDSAHAVCTLLPNEFGLYDMAGNALEWVNDWMAVFRPDTLTDFVGSLEAGTGLRPVKGGGFTHTVEKLRPSSRSDTYATVSSTATPYIGFRCCRGIIGHPHYLSEYAAADSLYRIFFCETTGNPLPSGGMKVACIAMAPGGGVLCCADFTGRSPRLYRYTDMKGVFLPSISPDGKWVAFCTRNEGAIDGSEVWIRQLDSIGSALQRLDDSPAFVPRWRVDPATSDTFIIYTSSTVLNTNLLWGQTATKKQEMSGGKPFGAPQVLVADGSFHGGLSADGHYLATGYPRLRMKKLPEGELRTLFTAPLNGKQPEDTSQVCNVSIAPGLAHPDRVLFLDFGSGRTASTVTGSVYFSHSILFMCSYSGAVERWYGTPEGMVEWDHPEWSNLERYAVAGAKSTVDPVHRSLVYLVDLQDSTYVPILTGSDIWHPSVWIAEDSFSIDPQIALDSAGWYNEPPSHVYQQVLAMKMPMFWEFTDSIEVLLLGSSRMENGGAPQQFAPRFTVNMSFSGGGLLSARHLLEDYALNHCGRLKAVVIGLDICWFNLPGGDDTWLTGTEHTRGFVYDRDHDFWPVGIPAGFGYAVAGAPHPENYTHDQFGWYKVAGNGWGADTISVPQAWAWEMDDRVAANLTALQTMAETAAVRGIQLIGVLTPMSPHYRETPVYGAYGPSRETAQEIIVRLQVIDSLNTSFTLYNANLSGSHDYTAEEFSDASHLDAAGAVKLSGRIDSVLQAVLERK
jgi:uncharacterized protein (TIGR02171 family)